MESINAGEASRAQASGVVAAQAGPGTPAGGSQSQKQPPRDPSAAIVAVAEQFESMATDTEEPVTQQSINRMLNASRLLRPVLIGSAVRCLGSERTMYDRDTKAVVKVADGTTIMKAVIFLAAYADGLPVQQTVNVNFDANKEMPVKEMLVKSPALRRAFRKQLEEAEEEAGDTVQKPGGQKQVGPPSEPPA